MQIADRVQRIAASQSLAMAARAKAMKAAGIDVISMSLGEPDMDTPEHIRRAAQEAIDNGWTHYGPVAGIPSLRETIATTLPSFQGGVGGRPIVFTASDVVVSVGAKMAIYNAIQTIINPGDEVVIPMPSWVSYTEMVKVAGGEVVPVQTKYENRYCLTPEELRAVLTDKTRMLILCSPNNPTGSVYSYEELKAIVEVLRDYPQVVVLSDEIYGRITYGPTPNPSLKGGEHKLTTLPSDIEPTSLPFREGLGLGSFPELQDRLIIVNGVSKAYAMTGWRIGWLMSKNKAFIEACTRLQGQQVTCATMVAQKAAEAALTGSQECVEQMRQVFAERRELICRLAAEIPGFRFEKPQGAFYLFPDVSALGDGDKVAEYLLEEAHVAVVSGSAFGCPECIRLSYAISTEEITEAMRRIKVAITRIVNKQK